MSLFAKLNELHYEQNTNENSDHHKRLASFRRANELPPFIQQFLVSRLALGYSEQTIQRYIYDFHFFFTYVKEISATNDFASHLVTLDDFLQLQQSGIQHYASYLTLEVENEPRTVNRKLSVLQSLFDYLIKEELAHTNPVIGVDRPKVAKNEPIYLTQQEVHKLLIEIKNDLPKTASHRQRKYHHKLKKRDHLVFYLLIATGLRISELAMVTMKQIHFTNRTLSVRGKGNKQRTIPLAQRTIDLIHEYVQSIPHSFRPVRADDHLLIGYNFTKGTYTKSVTVNALQKMIQRQIKRATDAIPSLAKKHITAHKLRHTFATALIENGVDVLTIQNLLGHESVATTQVYAHIQDDAKTKAIDELTYQP